MCFGDIASVFTLSTTPQSTLNKQHHALSYLCVGHESIAANIMYLVHVEGEYNPINILAKALGWVDFCPLVQLFSFWKGETIIDKPFPMVINYINDDCNSAL